MKYLHRAGAWHWLSLPRLALVVVLNTCFSCQQQTPSPNPEPLRVRGSLTVDGLSRYYLLTLPPTYAQNSTVPLVIFLHGTGGKAEQAEQNYHFSEKGNGNNFAVVYPEGVASTGPLGIQTWNAGTCCDYAQRNNIDDVKFIRLLLEELTRRYKLDARRVYATGISNGAMFCYRLACELPDKLAAIAPVSGPLLTAQPCQPGQSVPVLHIHSELDSTVPYQGGRGIAGYYFPPADSGLTVWAARNGCTPTKNQSFENNLYRHFQWQACPSNAQTELYLTKDGGHAWPGGAQARPGADRPSQAFNATDLVWAFFQRHARP